MSENHETTPNILGSVGLDSYSARTNYIKSDSKFEFLHISIQQRAVLNIRTIIITPNYHQISILELFLKDHVTLKPGVMLKIQPLRHMNKLHFKIEKLF